MNNQPSTEAPQDRATEDQHREMALFGISAEQKTVYHYQGYVYERLADALAYARISTAKLDATKAEPPTRVLS